MRSLYAEGFAGPRARLYKGISEPHSVEPLKYRRARELIEVTKEEQRIIALPRDLRELLKLQRSLVLCDAEMTRHDPKPGWTLEGRLEEDTLLVLAARELDPLQIAERPAREERDPKLSSPLIRERWREVEVREPCGGCEVSALIEGDAHPPASTHLLDRDEIWLKRAELCAERRRITVDTNLEIIAYRSQLHERSSLFSFYRALLDSFSLLTHCPSTWSVKVSPSGRDRSLLTMSDGVKRARWPF